MILPGATLGLLGGGQLGRMFTVAARTMGYRVMVLDPDPDAPAAHFANTHLCAPYEDTDALAQLGRTCAAVTTEFENVPAASLRYLSALCLVRPAADAVAVAQDRISEKRFLQERGFPVGPFAAVTNPQEASAAGRSMRFPALLKRSRLGYDGKGQIEVASAAAVVRAFEEMEAACVLEQKLDLALEVSAIIARGADGGVACFPVAENRHRQGVLDVSIVPARVQPALAERARGIAQAIAAQLDYIGVLAVEFFVLTDGRLLVNELAPRPHNSGHYTLDACATSQFEQQVRALCGLGLGDTRLLSAATMVNLLGDLWDGGTPPWERVLCQPQAKLHLYGKSEARPGRKMGHFTCLGGTAEDALASAIRIQSGLRQGPGRD